MPEKILEFLRLGDCAIPFMLSASTQHQRFNVIRLVELLIIAAASALSSYQIIEYRLSAAQEQAVELKTHLQATNARIDSLDKTLQSTQLKLADRWTGTDAAAYQYSHLKEHHEQMKDVTQAIEKLADRLRRVEIRNGG